jgi:hypothetical protein
MRMKFSDYLKYKNILPLFHDKVSKIGEYVFFTKEALMTQNEELYLPKEIFRLIEGLSKEHADPYFGGLLVINLKDIAEVDKLLLDNNTQDTKLRFEKIQSEQEQIQFPSLSNEMHFLKANYGPGLLSDTILSRRLYVDFLIEPSAIPKVHTMMKDYFLKNPESLMHPSKYPMTVSINNNYLKFSCLKGKEEYLKNLIQNLALLQEKDTKSLYDKTAVPSVAKGNAPGK